MQLALAFVLGVFTLLLVQEALRTRLTPGRPVVALEDSARSGQLGSMQLDLNAATEEELQLVPGIGPVLSARIIDHRRHFGRFDAVEGLREVHGMGPQSVERVRPFLYVTRSASSDPRSLTAPEGQSSAIQAKGKSHQLGGAPVDLNRATREQLMNLPGIGPVLADRIIANRTANGPFRSVADITRVPGIKGKTLEKVRPFVRVEETWTAKGNNLGG
jgi:competence ComEA-like helix-hairpin-helix protein